MSIYIVGLAISQRLYAQPRVKDVATLIVSCLFVNLCASNTRPHVYPVLLYFINFVNVNENYI